MYSVGWQLFHFSTESNISTSTQHMAGNAADKPKNVGDLF